jgi:ubiquinone/menaquinone biosynthesis C-methylase UbiE
MRMIRGLGAAVTLLVGVSVAVAKDDAADLTRLTEVLQVGPGSVVADVGAGPGALLTIPMATAVGPSGKVIATDIGDMFAKLRETVQKAGARNVEVIEGQPSNSNLPPECCDGIFIRNVYHHFADPAAMNTSLWASLKPGGRLAIIDFRPRGPEAISPADRDEGDQHGVSPESVTTELLAAAFQLIMSEDRSDADRWFLVVVEKPLRPILQKELRISAAQDFTRIVAGLDIFSSIPADIRRMSEVLLPEFDARSAWYQQPG